MQVYRSTEAENAFYAKLAAYYATRERDYSGSTFHVSDVLYPRKAYFKALHKPALSRAELGYFAAGEAHHDLIERVLGGAREQEVVVTENGITIIGRPDVVAGGEPTEVKTSRKWTVPDVPDDHYVDQLLLYCALLGARGGYLLVFYLTPQRARSGDKATTPEFVVWRVEFTPDELTKARAWMFRVGGLLKDALAKQEHAKLPLCDEWMCRIKRGKTYVALCPFYEACQPKGRWPLTSGRTLQ